LRIDGTWPDERVKRGGLVDGCRVQVVITIVIYSSRYSLRIVDVTILRRCNSALLRAWDLTAEPISSSTVAWSYSYTTPALHLSSSSSETKRRAGKEHFSTKKPIPKLSSYTVRRPRSS
jgi:hypothetical protein